MQKVIQCMNCSQALRRSLHLTSTCLAGGRWREKHGESQSANEYGPLVDIPDWSYADGRPAPLRTGELRRREKYRQLGEKVFRSLDELETAKDLYKQKQESLEKKQDLTKPRFKSKVQS